MENRNECLFWCPNFEKRLFFIMHISHNFLEDPYRLRNKSWFLNYILMLWGCSKTEVENPLLSNGSADATVLLHDHNCVQPILMLRCYSDILLQENSLLKLNVGSVWLEHFCGTFFLSQSEVESGRYPCYFPLVADESLSLGIHPFKSSSFKDLRRFLSCNV